VASYRPPPNVVPQPAGDDLGTMLVEGRLAATIGVDLDAPDVRPFFSDPDAAAYLALRERGLYPINHLVVVRDEVLEEHPDAAAALFEAFAESKRRYVAGLRSGRVDDATDAMYEHVMTTTGEDPLPYGVEPNRAMLETLVGHAVRQHIIDTPVPVDSLFHPATLDLVSA
jgi:4,5-dihydroxyphthalate decarboxylase